MLRQLIAAGLLALSAGSAAAQAVKETPTALEGAKVIGVDALRGIADRGGAAIFDLRKKASYVEGHVPGARNYAVFHAEGDQKPDLAFLGSDKAAVIVVYSHGADGWKSYQAAKAAVDAGYTGIHWFRGGWADWVKLQQPIAR
jgi:rhodanese-related sulfurtransferase